MKACIGWGRNANDKNLMKEIITAKEAKAAKSTSKNLSLEGALNETQRLETEEGRDL